MTKKVFVNQSRTPAQRRARYCYLTKGLGLNRSTARAIVGRTDNHIIKSIETLTIQLENNPFLIKIKKESS